MGMSRILLTEHILGEPAMRLFPEMIARHPAVDLSLEGRESHLIQAGEQQFVFMSYQHDTDIPEHAHAGQWGVVLDGEMELTVEGERRLLRRGDSYYLPAGARHSARIHGGYKGLTMFDEKDRYATGKGQ